MSFLSPDTPGPSRRGLLCGAATVAAAAPFIRIRPLRSKLKLAVIGTANRGSANIAGVLGQDVAFACDVDEEFLGRGVAQITKAGQAKPTTFRDWRELLAKHGDDLDGVVVSTPDHTHAAIARAALKRKIPVYCEKPLSRTVAEARQLRTLAKEAGVATQMGTQIHATENYRRVVEAIRSGAIGRVHTAHVFCSKSWSQGKFTEPKAPPKKLDWDLWLGPTAERDYCDGVHPASWRKFWAFGNGTVGDMACHWVDLVHWALDLGTPRTIEVEGPEYDEVGTPKWMHVRWGHPEVAATDTKPGRAAVDVHWWDGGMKPEFAPLDNAHLFLGTKGRIVSTYGSMEVQLTDKSAKWTPPPKSIAPSPGHYEEWLRAIANDGAPAPLCEFEYATRLTETVLLAGVAFRAGGKCTWDDEAGTASKGQEFVAAEERDGWDV